MRPGQIVGRPACLPFDDVAGRARVRGVSCAVDLAPRSPAATGGTRERDVRSHRRHLRQPRGRAGRPVRGDAGHGPRRPSVRRRRPSPRAPPAALVSQPVDGPHVLVDDTAEALEALGRAARERDRRRRSSGSPARSARPAPRKRCSRRSTAARRGPGPPLGQELQQPHRRAAEPGADAARRRIRGARNGHEQCRRDRRADPAGPAARRADHRDRPGAHREPRQRGGDRRRQGAKSSRGSSPTAIAIIPNDSPHRDRLVKAARAPCRPDHHLRRAAMPTSPRSTRSAPTTAAA